LLLRSDADDVVEGVPVECRDTDQSLRSFESCRGHSSSRSSEAISGAARTPRTLAAPYRLSFASRAARALDLPSTGHSLSRAVSTGPSARGHLAAQTLCPQSDSNRHWADFKSVLLDVCRYWEVLALLGITT
jgi:hypothetical protein